MLKASFQKRHGRRKFNRLTDDLAMAIWNHIAELPEFHQLKPHDYPAFYSAVQRVLRPYYRSIRGLCLAAALSLIACLPSRAYGVETSSRQLTLKPESRLYLTGTSTLHPYASTSTLTQITADLSTGAVTLADIASRAPFTLFEVVIPVKGLKSGESGLDKNMYKALKSETAPEIRFLMQRYDAAPPFQRATPFKAAGSLAIAGAKKDVVIEGTALSNPDELIVEGEYRLAMSDFGVKPPTLLFGAIKVADSVTIHFHLVFNLNKGVLP